MQRLEINGAEIPLLEPPHQDNDVPRRILDVLFKYKRFIIASFLILFTPLFLFVLLKPVKYVATSKVMIKPSRAYLNLAGSSSIHPSPEIINSEIQIIKSMELLERLAQEVPFPDPSDSPPVRVTEKNLPWIASALGARLKVAPVRLSNLIQISVVSKNPEWAMRVANKTAELYVDQHLKIHKTQGIEEFYDEQEKRLQMELSQAVGALKDYQQRENVVDAEKELAATMGAIASFETNLRLTESSIREITERTRILEAQLKDQRDNVQAGRSVASNPVVAKIYDRLTQLELERNGLLQRYTAKDRLVLDKESEIADLRNRLKDEEGRILQGEAVSLNSIHDGILNAVLRERAELNAMTAKRNTVRQQLATLSSQAASLKKKSYAYDQLQQEVNFRKEAVALYTRKGEEAKISDAMDEQKFSNAAIFEKAGPPFPRAGFKPSLLIAALLVFSLGFGVAGAFVLDYCSSTLRNEDDVEEYVGVPVLATIQHYRA